MAAMTTCAVTNATARSCTLTLSAAAVDLTPTTIRQLQQVLDKIAATCGGASSTTDAPAAVTLPADWGG